MAGTVLGAYLKKRYAERIQALTGNHGSMDDGTGYYGLMFYDKETHKGSKTHGPNTYMSLYGACGWNSMVRIANAIGVDVEYLEKDNYLLTEKAI